MANSDFRAESLKALDVEIHRARTQRASTGQRNLGFADARKQQARNVKRGPHPANQLVWSLVRSDVARPNPQGIGTRPRRFDA
jgi:hypothetical protein